MKEMLKTVAEGLSEVLFPKVCVCCGKENTQKDQQICSFCLQERFEDANPGNKFCSSDILLPEGIAAQHALWQFDKGGDLQDLLHLLKYERLTKIGLNLGRKLGERVYDHPLLACKIKEMPEAVILPVPLHYLKFRYRGFNQAFKIARGFQQAWPNIPICDVESVIRKKNTRTQTGFSLEKRLRNIEDAFEVRVPSVVSNKGIIIIDDVFTTGATTFELAQTVLASGANSVVILTVAQA